MKTRNIDDDLWTFDFIRGAQIDIADDFFRKHLSLYAERFKSTEYDEIGLVKIRAVEGAASLAALAVLWPDKKKEFERFDENSIQLMLGDLANDAHFLASPHPETGTAVSSRVYRA